MKNDAEEYFLAFFEDRKGAEYLQWKLAHTPKFRTEHPYKQLGGKFADIVSYFAVVDQAGNPEVYDGKPSIVSIEDVHTMSDAEDPIERHITISWWSQSRKGHHRAIEDGPAVIELISNAGKLVRRRDKYYLDGKRVARPKKSKGA